MILQSCSCELSEKQYAFMINFARKTGKEISKKDLQMHTTGYNAFKARKFCKRVIPKIKIILKEENNGPNRNRREINLIRS